MSGTSRTLPLIAAIIGCVQAAILLVNAFGWADITSAQGAAITAVVTAVSGVLGARKVNDQVGVALHTQPPEAPSI
jgi:hypothetical protein